MTMFYIIGGLVFGLFMFLMIRRSWKRGEKLDSFIGKVATCPGTMEGWEPDAKCGANLCQTGTWKRTRSKGDVFECSTCGTESVWDFDRAPPLLVDWDKPREPRKPRKPRRERKRN